VQTTLAAFIKDRPEGGEAAALLRACVHCGFCQATCPTYQLLGDELDSPRGRIHLIKQVLEGDRPTARTQLHLDRCLTCRACETACPSGVQYGRLLEIGRQVVIERRPRPWVQRMLRRVLAAWLTGPLFAPSVGVGRALRPLLPRTLAAALPVHIAPGAIPVAAPQPRTVLLLGGCVQPALAPRITDATLRVLQALGISTVSPPQAGCCGAIHQHLDAPAAALDDARRNIDAWWPQVQAGVEAIIVNTSGCGTQLRDYGVLLRDDPVYAARAAHVSALVRDVSELVAPQVAALRARAPGLAGQRVACHSPCSLQHAQRLGGVVEQLLTGLGVVLVPVAESALCCGAAGTYHLLQPALSQSLRERKLAALTQGQPQRIVSANLGCLLQLAPDSPVPIEHWIELVDRHLS